MRDRVKDVKRRIAKRRQAHSAGGRRSSRTNVYPLPKDEERFGEAPFMDYDYNSKWNKPIYRKELLMLQVLVAISLFLIVGILFKDHSPRWESARNFVSQSMEKEFQFATALDWYESQFGKPIALLPTLDEPTKINEQKSQLVQSEKGDATDSQIYAVPAAGRVLEPFTKDGKGIMVETGRDSTIEAVDEGVVVFAGVKDTIGKTVVIQHSDGSETWYGRLDSIQVKLYDFVESRAEIGKVTNTNDQQAGTFYFAFKQGDIFIDPNQVISFD